MPVSVREIIVIMSRNGDDVSTYLTETPSRKKSRSAVDEDETGNNTVSTYTESEKFTSPASNTRSAEKRKAPPLNDCIVGSDSDDDKEVVDAGLLSKNNPADVEKARAEVMKQNEYERTLFDVVSRQGPRRSSAIWKHNYFKQLEINRKGKRVLNTERKLKYVSTYMLFSTHIKFFLKQYFQVPSNFQP
jgi:hypothetical protein